MNSHIQATNPSARSLLKWMAGSVDRGRRSVSRDGLEWKNVEKPKAADTLVDIAFGAGRFVGVGLHGLRMASEDGLQWTQRFTGDDGGYINSVLWTGDRFVAVGAGATYLSPDGVTWERRANVDAPLIAAFGSGKFVRANWLGRLLASEDAIT